MDYEASEAACKKLGGNLAFPGSENMMTRIIEEIELKKADLEIVDELIWIGIRYNDDPKATYPYTNYFSSTGPHMLNATCVAVNHTQHNYTWSDRTCQEEEHPYVCQFKSKYKECSPGMGE